MSYYLIKYFQGTASYEAYQNKGRLLDWEYKKFLYESGIRKPVKLR